MLDYRAHPSRREAGGRQTMNRDETRANIDADLGTSLKTNTTQAVLTTGSFEYTEADITTIINNWHDLATSYNDSIDDAFAMTAVKGPGLDFASNLFANTANQSGESYLSYLKHNRDYCLRQAQLFQNALDDYQGVEHTNVTEIDKSAPQGPQHGV
jgi:hypothetical protein